MGTAKDRAIELGKEISRDYQGFSRDAMIAEMAKYAYELVDGFEQGKPSYDELTPMQQYKYVIAARFLFKMVCWHKGLDPYDP